MDSKICEKKPSTFSDKISQYRVVNLITIPSISIFFLILDCYSTNVAIQLDTLIIGTRLKNTRKRLHEKFFMKFT